MENKSNSYHPEPYWSEVAQRIQKRGEKNVVAGDDEPFYRYKREKFITLLKEVDFSNKKVLEVGCGPGGNLRVISELGPMELQGVDISNNMVELAKENLQGKNITIQKIDGLTLPFKDNEFDIVFTATVLQHNTNEKMLLTLMAELCRVSNDRIVIFEKIEADIKGDELCMGRPVQYYKDKFSEQGFKLLSTNFINIGASYLFSGIIRKGLNSSSRKEGEPLNAPSVFLQKISLPITKILDNIFKSKRDLAKLAFQKQAI